MSGPTISTSATKIEALQLQSSAYGVTVAKGYGVYKAPGNLVDYLDFKAKAKKTSQGAGKGGGSIENTTYTYTATIIMGLGHGPITDVRALWKGKNKIEALSEVGLTLFNGAIGQAPWPTLASINAEHQIGYSGLAYVAAQNYKLAADASLENHNFEVVDQFAFSVSPTIPDADPADFLADILPNNRYGAGFGATLELSALSAYCRAAGILMSPYLSEQQPAADLLRKAAQLTNSGIVWSNNQLTLVPYGDAELTGNGATYTPDNVVRYHLTDDHFCNKREPVRQERVASSDRQNHFRIEFRNRANDYAIEIAEDKDDVDIDVNGHRPADVIQAHWICDADVAKRVASLLLQRSLFIVNRWTFELPWHFCRLEPGKDIVTLTDPASGLDRTPVRIVEKRESADKLVFVAEDFPYGVRPGDQASGDTGGGTPVDFNAEAGDVAQPVFFELPVEMSTTGLEVAVAVTGVQQTWGGCRVWASNDGTNYREIATVFGGARYGALTAPLAAAPGGALSVQLAGLGGEMFSATQLDSERLTTLCMVRGTTAGDRAEFLAYQTSSLVGTNQYTLTGLTRGGYGTDQGAKLAGSQFVRVDELVARSGPLELDAIGRQLYFKFTSFNMVGNREQPLEDVQEYVYTITGEMVYLPPPAVTALTPTPKVFGIDLSWVIPQQASRLKATEIWMATTNDRAEAVLLSQFAYPQAAHQITGLASGEHRWFWARLVDEYDNTGAWYPTNPLAGVPGMSSADADTILDYLAGKIGETQLSAALLERIEGAEGASVQVEALTTDLSAMYTIKTSLTVSGRLYMAGLGIGVENTNGVVESQVLVAADKFAIIDPTAETLTSPFIVQDGQTYINQAFIGEGWITNAMIGNVIRSNDFDLLNDIGWQIDKQGTIRAFNLYARGDIEATSIKADSANIVKTIHLQDEAVTVPVGGQYSGGGAGVNWSPSATVLSLPSTDFGGGKVTIVVFADIQSSSGIGDMLVRLFRGSTEINVRYVLGHATGAAATYRGQIGFAFQESPGSGSHAYSIRVGTPGGANIRVYDIAVALIGSKK